MIGPDFMDELDGSFFDHIDDLLVDFSGDDVDAAGLGPKPESNSFPSIWSTQSDSLPTSDSVFSGHSASADLSAELSVPYEDIVQLEWLSNFVEDSFSGGGSLTMETDQELSQQLQFHTSSPVSVLESSSSCSGGEKSPDAAGAGARHVRARSKRPRPATFNPRPAINLIASEPTHHPFVPTPRAAPAPAPASSDSDNFAESQPAIKAPTAEPQKKKKKIKLSFPLAPPAPETSQNAPSVRKCMHCEITKTPQWRAGPMGPKTLCNACGVRYKSGRLFPEYRPAASPTFVPSVHSNSHKKVLEMRGKDCGGGAAVARPPAAAAAAEPAPELIPNTNSGISLDYM